MATKSRYLFFVLVILLGFGGCAMFPKGKTVSKNQTIVEKSAKAIENTSAQLIESSAKVNKQASILATGTQYSLNAVTNPPIEVVTAKTLNERIITILGAPNLDEQQKIKETVRYLNAAVAEERIKGEKMLKERDAIITQLQNKSDLLNAQYEQQVSKITEDAGRVAKNADANQAIINDINSFFGLKAVFYGLKRFFFTCLTGIIIFAVIFIALRIFSTMNPIAGALFSFFDAAGATLINTLKGITPKAIKIANLVPHDNETKYKSVLLKVVDSIEEIKFTNKLKPETQFTLVEILDKFAKEFDEKDKEVINQLTLEAKWKK